MTRWKLLCRYVWWHLDRRTGRLRPGHVDQLEHLADVLDNAGMGVKADELRWIAMDAAEQLSPPPGRAPPTLAV